MTDINKYPYYSVEGRRFEFKDFHFAVAFAKLQASKMGRPVSVIRTLDSMTPDSVIFTAEPETNI